MKLRLFIIETIFCCLLLCACSENNMVSDFQAGVTTPKQTDLSNIKQEVSELKKDENVMNKAIKYQSHDEAEEFAPDMHRPFGYNNNIGSALALKMDLYKKNPDYLYNTIIYEENNNIADCMSNVNNRLGYTLDDSLWIKVSVEADISPEIDKYFCSLRYEEIGALAASNIKCFYVGSGVSPSEFVDWNTEEGIDSVCEALGDMYTEELDKMISEPDLWSE